MNKIHLIGNAHLDPVWLWQWYEGYAEVKATFRSALDRMKEFPDYKFTSACAAYYEWVRDSDPAMFDEIRERVKEGRWCVTGGWYIQPDCNIPSGESFILRVRGDSMINAGIFDGDRVFVNSCNTARNGEIIVALVDDSATVKTFYKEKDHIRLQPENDTMDPIIVDDCQILGKVFGVFRLMR